ncbi:MAG: DUF11 domain-containing protein [Waddliaceae bacterium]
MRKQLGIVTSLLFLGVSTIFWTGCHHREHFDPCYPCEQIAPEKQVSPDPCYEPLCKPLTRCCYPSTNQLCCVDGITVRARNPKLCMLGEQYSLDFEVQACDDVCDAVMTAYLPDGVTYLRSEPQAKEEGQKLTWDFGCLRKGECRPAKVFLECECEGELCACFSATATPVRFCSLLCAKPLLTCQKCGPEEVCPGEGVNYTITVTNRGSCAAEDVCLTDNVPEGLEHSSGLRALVYKLGSIQPCESKRVNICFQACKRGDVCNTAVVSSCNADSTSCQWCTKIRAISCEAVKVGPKEQQIGKNADYQITVTNTGDKTLTDVSVIDCSSTAMTIISANGAMINGNQAVWRIRELKPGEKVSFTTTLTTCTAGCFTNRVTVTSNEGCNCCDDFITRWKGRPALSVCICDTEDPICIGDSTSYWVTVVNQGSEPDDDVRVVIRFPSEIVPLSATGDTPGSVSGNTVTFAPYDNLGPRQTVKYRVDAKASDKGEGRVMCEVTSNSIQSPIVQQESTIIQ